MNKKLDQLRHRAKRYPPLTRQQNSAAAAVASFRRIYEFGSAKGYSSLMIFAAYKALQKLEKANVDETSDRSQPTGERQERELSIPPWVVDGLWLVVEALAPAPVTGKTIAPFTSGRFPRNLSKLWIAFDRWYPIKQLMDSETLTLNAAVVRLFGDASAGQADRNAYEEIEGLLAKLNKADLNDEDESPLVCVKPRDLLATGHLRSALGFSTQ